MTTTTISLYNHTRARFFSGANDVGDAYKVKLFTAATFDPTHTTESAAGGTEVVNDGYTAGGATLANVTVTTVSTNHAKWDADNPTWTAAGTPLAASYARIYHVDDSAPLAFIDFGREESAGVGTEFRAIWDEDGIFTSIIPV
jgi:hypothetical protein